MVWHKGKHERMKSHKARIEPDTHTRTHTPTHTPTQTHANQHKMCISLSHENFVRETFCTSNDDDDVPHIKSGPKTAHPENYYIFYIIQTRMLY